ncbi:MAG: hypothetical protein MR409_10680 [Lachnospiraceae bacterium]|nr:hypothetical protein [Lachnospiraceae bacterium]
MLSASEINDLKILIRDFCLYTGDPLKDAKIDERVFSQPDYNSAHRVLMDIYDEKY